MNKKLSLFPMTRNQCAIARFSSLLQGYTLAHCLTPGFKRLDNVDTNRLDGGEPTGIMLSSFDSDKLIQSDILFVDYDERVRDLTVYQDVISSVRDMGKEVVLSDLLTRMLSPRQEAMVTLTQTHILETPETDTMYDIDVPVITILTQGRHADQFATELALRKYLLDTGYEISHISSLEYGRFFGLSPIPASLYEPKDAYEKTVGFNHYVKSLLDRENPELMIMSVPGAVAKYSNRQLQGLGILPTIMCGALRSDAVVFCMYQANYDIRFFDMVHNLTQYKFDCPASFFSVANVMARPDINTSGDTLAYVNLDSDFVLNSIRDDMEHGDYILYNALNSESAKAAGMAIQRALTDNADSMH